MKKLASDLYFYETDNPDGAAVHPVAAVQSYTRIALLWIHTLEQDTGSLDPGTECTPERIARMNQKLGIWRNLTQLHMGTP